MTYNVITEEMITTGKGLVNNQFTRYITTGDNIFGVFIRAFAHRNHIPNKKMQFIIVDKNPAHLDMFKEVLKWDGELSFDDRQTAEEKILRLRKHLHDAAQKLNLQLNTVSENKTLGRAYRHDFLDFTKAWQAFKDSDFSYHCIDVVTENNKFLNLLYNLPDLGLNKNQFLGLKINHGGSKEYIDAINNVLHLLWIKHLKEYSTVVELSDENNQNIEDFAGKIYVKLNPTFCVLPWMHIQYKPSGQSKLCCRYDTVNEAKEYDTDPKDNLSNLVPERMNLLIQKTSMENSFNSNYWNTARKLTVDNKPISGCHKCYKEEKSVGEVATSMRLGSSILYNNGYLHKKPKFENPVIEFLEVGFGNYCNLACLSCNSTLSTSWHDDEIKLNSSVNENLQRIVFPKLDNLKFVPDQSTLKTLKIIKFTGGEPMINPEFIKFIDVICEQGTPENISLEIYTNCSYIPSPKLLENLVKFKNVQLNLSIDAYGSVNDYIRYGSKWEGDGKQTVNNAIDFWLSTGFKHDNFSIIMSTTLSILNVLEIPKLMTWWLEKFKHSGNKIIIDKVAPIEDMTYYGFFKLQPAHDPSYININSLPKEYYSEVLNWIEDYRNKFLSLHPEINGIPECIGASLIKLSQLLQKAKGNVEQCHDLLNYLYAMDKIRKNSCEENIPEIVDKVKQYLQAQGKQI